MNAPTTKLDERVLDGHINSRREVKDYPTKYPLQTPRPKPKDAPADDKLASLSPREVAEFYRRLAKHVLLKRPKSLAGSLLLHWLDGKGVKKVFDADYVKDLVYVTDYFKDEVRPVFLTQKRAKLGEKEKWAGVLPRIKKMPGFTPWDGCSDIPISYEGPSLEIPITVYITVSKAIFKMELGFDIDEEDEAALDRFMSLHKFGIHTDIIIEVKRISDTEKYTVTFKSWESKVFDNYNWDEGKHLTLPNPDYRNPFGVIKPVAPDKRFIQIYHSNAKRVERENLSAPFDMESTPWRVTSENIVGPAVVDASRAL